MKARLRKKFKQGDQINIIVTNDFADTANQFYKICKEHHFNASEVIRSSIESWVTEQIEMLKFIDNIKRKRQYTS